MDFNACMHQRLKGQPWEALDAVDESCQQHTGKVYAKWPWRNRGKPDGGYFFAVIECAGASVQKG